MEEPTQHKPLLAVSKITAGTLTATSFEGRELLVARVGDEFFVSENRCPHMGARLSEGTLEGTIVVCPRHHSRFDLRDGRVLQWTNFKGAMSAAGKLFRRPQPLRTFAVKVDGDMLLIGPEKPLPTEPPSAEQ